MSLHVTQIVQHHCSRHSGSGTEIRLGGGGGGGGAGVRGCKAANYLREASASRGQKLGGG